MKKSLFTLLLCFGLMMSYGQVKVYSSGKTVMGSNTGITTPEGTIHVVRSLNESAQAIFADAPASATSFTSTYSSLYLSNSQATNNNYSRLNFGDGDAAAVASVASRIENHGANGGSLEFWTRPTTGGAAITKRMGIQSNGNVIIGSGSANALLSVNGNASKVGGGTWSIFSDKRLKSDIKPFEDGLEQILAINPVKFRYNGKAGITDTESEFVGVIAQDMEKVAPYTVKNVEVKTADLEIVKSELDRGLEENSRSVRTENFKQFDPNALTYMLINAVKEQQEIIEDKEDRISDLEARLSKIENLVESFGSLDNLPKFSEITLDGNGIASLSQNAPNPFRGSTTIDYIVPLDASDSQILIYNVTGNLMKSLELDHTGQGVLKVNVHDLPSGVYSYKLVVDGIDQGTKKMILQ